MLTPIRQSLAVALLLLPLLLLLLVLAWCKGQ
jgi:hypothetical protein